MKINYTKSKGLSVQKLSSGSDAMLVLAIFANEKIETIDSVFLILFVVVVVHLYYSLSIKPIRPILGTTV